MLRLLTLMDLPRDWLVVAAACVAAAAVTLAVAYLLLRMRGAHLGNKARLIELALNNMTQGVVMFDATGRLIVCNARYLDLYTLPADAVKPGAMLGDIVQLRARTGSLPGTAEQYCADLLAKMAAGQELNFVSELPDGRSIAVVNRAIPAAIIGSAPTTTSRRAARPSARAHSLPRKRRAAPRSKRRSPGSGKASRACSTRSPTASSRRCRRPQAPCRRPRTTPRIAPPAP